MHKKMSSFLFIFILSLTYSGFSQQFSSKILVLKTTRYELDVKVDYKAEKIFGFCRLTVHNPSDEAISEIPLLLYRLLKVKAITDEKGAAVPYQQSVLSFEDWEQLQANYVEARLSKPLASGQSKTIAIVYEGFLFGYPPCCVNEYIRHPYTQNGFTTEQQKILFHWACKNCEVTPFILPVYQNTHNLVMRG